MWELIKNDPVLKTIFVLVIGVFAFAFAFSIMFGAGQGGMEHGMGSGGYNAANSLGHIILLLSKVLIIIILVAVIIVAVKFIQKHVAGSEPIKGLESLKNKPTVMVLAGLGGIAVLFLAGYMLSPSANAGMAMKSAANYGYRSYGFGITGLLVAVIKLIMAVSFIGLTAGFVMYLKERYFTDSASPKTTAKEFCKNCGIEMRNNWICCPSCGTEKKSKAEEATPEENEEK